MPTHNPNISTFWQLVSFARAQRKRYNCNAGHDGLSRIGLARVWHGAIASSSYPATQRDLRASSAMKRIGACENDTTQGMCGNATFRVSSAVGRQRIGHYSLRYVECSNCQKCQSCCVCAVCSACGDRSHRYEEYCSECARCSECCACVSCRGCEGTVRNTCNDCDYCNDCCECEDESECKVEFFTNPVKFWPSTRAQRKINPSQRFVAAEIEVSNVSVAGDIEKVVQQWQGSIVHDGSLPDSGFEINTSPASGDVFVTQVTNICDSVNKAGGIVDTKCGLHVHVDARDLRYYELQRLIKLYAAFEDVFFAMVPHSRTTSQYCLPCGKEYVKGLKRVNPKDGYKALKVALTQSVYHDSDTRYHRKDKYNGARYNALNLHSWFYRGTIECRMFNGTTSADKIVAWGMMWAKMVDLSASMDNETVDDILEKSGQSSEDAYYQFMKALGDNGKVTKFINERILQHGSDALKSIVTAAMQMNLFDTRDQQAA